MFYIRICSLIILSSKQMACILSILTAFFEKSWGEKLPNLTVVADAAALACSNSKTVKMLFLMHKRLYRKK